MTRMSITLSDSAIAQLDEIMQRHNLLSRNAAINFAIAGAYYELTRADVRAGRRG